MKITKELYGTLNALGQEIMDPRPAFISTGPTPLTITEQIRRLMRVELSRQAADQGFETFEESDDFEDDELDDAPQTAYQDERLMKPDWPGPQETPKKVDLDDLDISMPHEDQQNPEGQGGGAGDPPPHKGVPAAPGQRATGAEGGGPQPRKKGLKQSTT